MDAIFRIRMLRLALCAWITAASAAAAGVNASSDQPDFRDVAFGETVVITYLLEASDATPYVRLAISAGSVSDGSWQLRLLDDPGCGPLLVVGSVFKSYELALAPFAERSTRSCRVAVTRGMTAYSAISVAATPVGTRTSPYYAPPIGRSASVSLGESTDIAVRVETNTFSIDAQGVAHSDVRLVVTNSGPTGVRPITVGGCLDNIFPSFTIDSNGPDGCGSLDYSPLCFDYGYGLRTPAIPAHSEFSCRMRLNGRTPHRGQDFAFIGIDPGNLVNLRDLGGRVIDRDHDNDQTIIPFGPAGASAIPSIGPAAMLVLALALIAASCLRRRLHAPT